MEYEYTLSLGLSNPKQKKHLTQALTPIISNLDEFDKEDLIDELTEFIENDDQPALFFLPFTECLEEYYTHLITDCLVLLSKAAPEYSFGANFLITNYSSDGNRLVEYHYDKSNLFTNILDTDSSLISECYECGEELEDLIELSAHDISATYTCPYCGAPLDFGNEKLTKHIIDPKTHIIEQNDDWELNIDEEDED